MPVRPGVSWRRYAVVSVILILLVIVLRRVFPAMGDLLTPQSADLATVLDSGTTGVHWSDAMSMAGSEADQPDISAAGNQVAVTWNDGDWIYFAQAEWDRNDNVTR